MKSIQKNYWGSMCDDVVSAYYGLQHFIESAALVIVSVYTAYGAFHYHMNGWLHRTLIISAAIIGLRGALEFIRCLAREGHDQRQYKTRRNNNA